MQINNTNMKDEKKEKTRKIRKGIKTNIKNRRKVFLKIDKNDKNLNDKLREIQSLLDKSKKKRIFHQRKVSRAVSRIFDKYNELSKL